MVNHTINFGKLFAKLYVKWFRKHLQILARKLIVLSRFCTALFYEDQDVVKAYKSNSHCMRITSQFGLNIQALLHSSQHGLHYLKLVLVHHYSTYNPIVDAEAVETLIFHQTGN